MGQFKLVSDFLPTGDQPAAIKRLAQGIDGGLNDQVLLGVTGSGKTFTIANVIATVNRPTLVICHNKTLAGQLYQEFREFFPANAVSYFVSYYDYYQPEAYIPQTDTYIAKETDINEEIDKLRLRATANLLTRNDTLIIASVSCIYNIGSPKEYGNYILELKRDKLIDRQRILAQLVNLQYVRSGYDFSRGSFRVRGETIDIYPAYADSAVRVNLEKDKISDICELNPLTGQKGTTLRSLVIYPARHYLINPQSKASAFAQIRKDLTRQIKMFKQQHRQLAAERLLQRVNYDLEMISEIGYVNGIENYSRYFDGRKAGDPPYTLLDYFCHQYGNEWLLVIDESHMTIPQVRGMYRGDRARKKTLIDFGFRLPAALDNRPLRFDEFLRRKPTTIYVSATPANWEKQRAGAVIEQLIRPTGLVDPVIEVRPTEKQIANLALEIALCKQRGERVLVTTLTKKIAEELTRYLNSPKKINRLSLKKIPQGPALNKLNVQYLHADIKTLDRQDILDDLRRGIFDVVVGINLLREGLDLPEVSLVAILDADKEGFLRSETSLIQTMGRAARHIKGKVIMYADTITASMRQAIAEVERRRTAQIEYNRKHRITPRSISKPIRKQLVHRRRTDKREKPFPLAAVDYNQLVPLEKKKLIAILRKEMRRAAKALDFEQAALLRDKVAEIKLDLFIFLLIFLLQK